MSFLDDLKDAIVRRDIEYIRRFHICWLLPNAYHIPLVHCDKPNGHDTYLHAAIKWMTGITMESIELHETKKARQPLYDFTRLDAEVLAAILQNDRGWINKPGRDGLTVLEIAGYVGSVRLIKWLFDRGGHYATLRNAYNCAIQIDAIRFLQIHLTAGNKLTISVSDGLPTPLELLLEVCDYDQEQLNQAMRSAATKGDIWAIKLLRSHGATAIPYENAIQTGETRAALYLIDELPEWYPLDAIFHNRYNMFEHEICRKGEDTTMLRYFAMNPIPPTDSLHTRQWRRQAHPYWRLYHAMYPCRMCSNSHRNVILEAMKFNDTAILNRVIFRGWDSSGVYHVPLKYEWRPETHALAFSKDFRLHQRCVLLCKTVLARLDVGLKHLPFEIWLEILTWTQRPWFGVDTTRVKSSAPNGYMQDPVVLRSQGYDSPLFI